MTDLREALAEVRELVLHGDRQRAVRLLDRALQELDAARLLTTTEAASVLGIRSVNTFKLLLRADNVPTTRHGNRTMIALGEVERLRNSERLRGLHTSGTLHDSLTSLGEEPVSQEVLDIIAEGRPGTPPWERENQT